MALVNSTTYPMRTRSQRRRFPADTKISGIALLHHVRRGTACNSSLQTSASDSTESEQCPLRFLDLPAEVRLSIYDYDTQTRLVWITSRNPIQCRPPGRSGLSTTCRTAYRESKDAFFRFTTFAVDLRVIQWHTTNSRISRDLTTSKDRAAQSGISSSAFQQWLQHIGDKNAGLITKLSFYCRGFAVKTRIEKGTVSLTIRLTAGSKYAAGNSTIDRTTLDNVVQKIQQSAIGGPLRAVDLGQIADAVEDIQTAKATDDHARS